MDDERLAGGDGVSCGVGGDEWARGCGGGVPGTS
jgi:hypothetical protein